MTDSTTGPFLVDSHCHLNFPDFEEDLDDVLTNARQHNIGMMQTICTHLDEFDAIYAIAQSYPQIYCSAGVHPNNVADHPMVEEPILEVLCRREQVIGIGETGLDYYYEHAPRDRQQESFRRHLRVAQRTGLPVIIHTRNADEDTVAMLKEAKQEADFPALIHCFSSSQWLAEECIAMGIYISIPGIVTFKNATALQAAVADLPLESLLVETDAPYLAPAPHRGKRNEPAFTRHTAEKVAEIKQVPLNQVMQVTTDNFFRLFTKAERNRAII